MASAALPLARARSLAPPDPLRARAIRCQGLYSATPAGGFVPGLEFSGTVLKLGKAVKPIDDWCPAVGDQVGCGCVQGSAGPARAGGGEPASERVSGNRSVLFLHAPTLSLAIRALPPYR
jgi:NADPH:quinone reductase-like Zn-dependent oxidoreductase